MYFSEDFLRPYNEGASFNRALLEIDDILNVHNLSCQILRGMFTRSHVYSQTIEQANSIDIIKQGMLFW